MSQKLFLIFLDHLRLHKRLRLSGVSCFSGCLLISAALHFLCRYKRGVLPKLLLNCPQSCLIFIPIFHQIHLVTRKRCMLCLQLHCLIHIFSKTKHQHKLITGHNAQLVHACLVIQCRKLIKPFFIQLYIAVLLKCMNQLLCRCSFRLQNQITQNILARVIRCQVTKFPVIVFCLLYTAFSDCQLCQLKEQPFSNGRPLKSQ